jgi:O-antigen polymerase
MPQLPKKYARIPALVIILLLFVTPFVVSNELYNGTISAKEIWFFGVVALILFYTGVKLFFNKEQLLLKLNLPDILLLSFYAWCFIRACFTPYTPFYYNHKLQILTGCLVVYFFIKSALLNERNENNLGCEEKASVRKLPSFVNFIIYSFIVSGLFQAVYGLLQLYGVFPSNHSLFKITGSFFNPAPYALYLAVVFPLALGVFVFGKKEINKNNERNEGREKNEGNENNLGYEEKASVRKFSSFFHSFIFSFKLISSLKFVSLATLIAILLVLPATMIRASWLGALAGSLVVLQYKYNFIGKIKNWLHTKTRIVIACVLALIITAITGFGLYKFKEGSSVGKTFIWEVTLGKIAEKPLFGHGLGRFEAEYNNWQAEYFQKHPSEIDGPKGMAAGNTNYCFNEYLEMASETGTIGVILFLTMIITLITSINKILQNEKSVSVISFFAAMIALLFISFISFPFYSLPTLILLFFLFAVLSAYMSEKYSILLPKPIKYIASILFTGCVIGIVYNQYNNIIAYKRWQDANTFYQTGNYSFASIEYAQTALAFKYNGNFAAMYSKSLQMAGENEKSIIMLIHAKNLIINDVIYTTLGDAYKETGQYSKAENAYLLAHYTIPHKMYPLYLLAKLYSEQEKDELAAQYAQKVLQMDVKVESEAVKEIKEDLKITVLKMNNLK